MSDDSRHDGLADVINLLAAPIAGGIRTVEHVKRGVDELFRALENLNRTMENLNEAATRVNRFMADVEEPVRALMPQIRRTVETADEITTLLQAPVRAAAPNIERIAGALGSPDFLALPAQLGQLMQRLGPLAQLAENAGGLFGGFRLPGMPGPKSPAPVPVPAPSAPATAASASTPSRSAAKHGAANTGVAKRSVAKRSAAKKAPTTAKTAATKTSAAARRR
jgi:ABC-type transporter Mla subunit MlaD